jgi:uncharacterized protein YjlB
MDSDKLYFKDDGSIPNSRHPVLIYHNAFDARDDEGAEWLEKKFSENGWSNSWRDGMYAFHHYHSTSHEVLGIYSGKALIQLGGQSGQQLEVHAGDILIIPAGVGHKKIQARNLGIVGAYPEGRDWDLNRGLKSERPKADKNIEALPIPATDPLLGKSAGLPLIWK